MRMTAHDLYWAASALQQRLDEEIRTLSDEDAEKFLPPADVAYRKQRHEEARARIGRIERAAKERMRRDVKAGR